MPFARDAIAAGCSPRDPEFAAKAGHILDLCAGRWRGKALEAHDCVLSADEKTSIQAGRRLHPSLSIQPNRPARVEHEDERLGAWADVAAGEVRRATVFSRCEAQTGIAAFDRPAEGAQAERFHKPPRPRGAPP